MLSFDPKKRITAKQAYEDPWIQSFIKDKTTRDARPLNVNVLNNLMNFTQGRRLQAAIFQYVAHQLISPDEEFQIREIF